MGGVARTITARYFKNSVANFLRHDGMGNTGVMVIYDSENRQRQVDALRIGWWGKYLVLICVKRTK